VNYEANIGNDYYQTSKIITVNARDCYPMIQSTLSTYVNLSSALLCTTSDDQLFFFFFFCFHMVFNNSSFFTWELILVLS